MGENKIFPKVFLWLFVGLLVSGVTAFYVSNQPNMMYNIYEGNWYFWLVLAELAVVIFLSARIHKMSHMTAIISYLLYSILTGTTLSVIFAAFTTGSIAIVFGITALIFAIFAMIGYTTKADEYLIDWITCSDYCRNYQYIYWKRHGSTCYIDHHSYPIYWFYRLRYSKNKIFNYCDG